MSQLAQDFIKSREEMKMQKGENIRAAEHNITIFYTTCGYLKFGNDPKVFEKQAQSFSKIFEGLGFTVTIKEHLTHLLEIDQTYDNSRYDLECGCVLVFQGKSFQDVEGFERLIRNKHL